MIVTADDTFKQGWRSGLPETRCGIGSTITNSAKFIEYLSQVIDTYKFKKINDAGCGDFNSLKTLSVLDTIDYIGYDIILTNEKDNIKFKQLDISIEVMRECDVILCRYVLFHFPTEVIVKTLNLFKKSGSFLITDSYPGANNYKRNMQFSLMNSNMNITAPPFNLGEPLEILDDALSPRYFGLWEL